MYFYEEQFYQDPNLGYEIFGGGYNEHGYEPPPPPDKNWVDPVKVNRSYLEKIKKEYIQEEFQNLKTQNLFLLEILVESIELNEEAIENLASKDTNDHLFMTCIKFLDFSFLEIEESFDDGLVKTTAHAPSYEDLFQSVFTSTRACHETDPSEQKKEENFEIKNSFSEISDSIKRESSTSETPPKKSDTVDKNMFEVMKGKSALFSMTGLEMIKTLLKSSITVQVIHRDVGEEEHLAKEASFRTASIRTPKTLCHSVLQSTKPDSILPVLGTATEKHPLLNAEGEVIGEILLNISLAVFGKAVISCVREVENENYKCTHPTALRSFKSVDVYPQTLVDPCLATEILNLGLPKVYFKTSSEILQKCLTSNLIEAGDEERKRLLQNYACHWLTMAKDVFPKQESESNRSTICLLDVEEKKMDALWEEHTKMCRDLSMKRHSFVEDERKRSLYDRLEEIKIQTGLAILDTNNPFENEGKISTEELDRIESSERKKSLFSEESYKAKHSEIRVSLNL